MSLLFMIIVAAGLPFLTALSYRNIKKMEAELDGAQIAKIPVYLQSMAMQVILCVLAYFAGRTEQLSISLSSSFTAVSISASVGLIALALGLAWISQKYSKEKDESTLHHILPDTAVERLMWVLACVVAGFCEEYIYRGVLFQMIMTYTEHIWILAAILSAVVFAFGHGTQGERAIIQIIPFAIGFQFLAWISGGLLLPMIAHFIYNILVELLFGDKIKKDAEA
ncbi:MAG: CPBP family intramembrane metalloprotease [Chitinophagaceae bacterium]|jgi:membrane protease YdiL (CAAX protease family)|nr:CPBP family intramembrane metalloprotease [Chitinophagaceae bacterium]